MLDTSILDSESLDPDTLDPDLRHNYDWNVQQGDQPTARFQFVIQADRDSRRARGIHFLVRPVKHDAQSVNVPARPPGYLHTVEDDQILADAKTEPVEDEAAVEVQGFVNTPGDLVGPEPAQPKKAPAKRAPRKQAE